MFGKERADRFQNDTKIRWQNWGIWTISFHEHKYYYQLLYHIHDFLCLVEQIKEIHVLRVLREERDWQHILNSNPKLYIFNISFKAIAAIITVTDLIS